MRNLPRLLIIVNRLGLATYEMACIGCSWTRDELRGVDTVKERRSLFESTVLCLDDESIAEGKLDHQPDAIDDLGERKYI